MEGMGMVEVIGERENYTKGWMETKQSALKELKQKLGGLHEGQTGPATAIGIRKPYLFSLLSIPPLGTFKWVKKESRKIFLRIRTATEFFLQQGAHASVHPVLRGFRC